MISTNTHPEGHKKDYLGSNFSLTDDRFYLFFFSMIAIERKKREKEERKDWKEKEEEEEEERESVWSEE